MSALFKTINYYFMERRNFISGIGKTAAFICSGSLLNACSKSSSSPSTSLPFTIDLGQNLSTVGSSKINGNIVVIRIAASDDPSSFDALSLICTHQGCSMNYDSNNSVLFCPCHGSMFDMNGKVLQGPATQPVKKYTVTVSNNILTVS